MNFVHPCSHDALDIVGVTHARPSVSSVDHAIDMPWQNFLTPKFGGKFTRKIPLFTYLTELPYNTV